MPSGSVTILPFGIPLPERVPRQVVDESLLPDLSAARSIEVGIPMRDGAELAADVHLPPATQLPAPAIVLGTPYDKGRTTPNILEYRDAGYATVAYDVRGRGKSEGIFHAHTAIEAQDGHDVVEWVAAQTWCDGKVGAVGLSYAGWIVWATMSEKPPHLCAAVSLSAAGRWQQEVPYTYGCFWLYYAYWFAMVRRRIRDLNQDIPALLEILPVSAIGDVLKPAGPSWQEFLDHDALDELWLSRRWDGKYDFDVPCLHVTGWHDHEDLQGAFHHYEQMVATSPVRDLQWLVVGPWSHLSTLFPSDEYSGVEYPGGGIDMTSIRLRFFDRFLRDRDNGVDESPRTWLYDTGARSWNVRSDWQADTVEQRFFLADGRSLASEPSTGGEASYRYDPMDAPGVRFDTSGLWEPPLDLGELESHPGVLTWTSAPLEEDLTVHGWSAVELWASTDGDDTDWHVKLADVDPDDLSLRVGWGCLRASHGEDLGRPRPIAPHAVVHYEIEVTPAFHTFRAGHRVRLVLASAEFPWFARSMNRFGPIAHQHEPRIATNTVYFGRSWPSCLHLRVEGERRPDPDVKAR